MQTELIKELKDVWDKLHHIANSHDELYFFQKNPEMDSLTEAINELRPLVIKYGIY